MKWRSKITLYEILPNRRKRLRTATGSPFIQLGMWKRDLSDGNFVVVEELPDGEKEIFFTIKR